MKSRVKEICRNMDIAIVKHYLTAPKLIQLIYHAKLVIKNKIALQGVIDNNAVIICYSAKKVW